MFRDTGAARSLMQRSLFPNVGRGAKESELLRGVGGTVNAPLVEITIEAGGDRKKVTVGLTDDIPIGGLDVLLSNNVRARMQPSGAEEAAGDVDEEEEEVAVVTRAMARCQTQEQQEASLELGIGELFTIPQMDEPRDVVENTAEGPAAGCRGNDGDGEQLAAGLGRDDVAQQSGESCGEKGRLSQEGLGVRST
ncbi:hypothetical protein E2C01_010759 [Portunus trituberculatus]|uniref:Peptidase A2 domain-containing protein n=1 Tax=Portunus trituberculatus TaxID=210409 RepID=A0A5B7D990_PORTR|nr:hypothetical protein [Portunus trituberculatus]